MTFHQMIPGVLLAFLLVFSEWGCSDSDGGQGSTSDVDTDGDSDGDTDADTDTDTDTDADTDAETDTDTDADSDSDSDGDTDADSDSDGAESCRLVDVVIGVDGSSSMSEERRAMHETVFPAFAKRLISISKGLDDFRVATLDGCPYPANFHTRGKSGACNFVGGNVWIESSSPNIESEFSCVGEIYLGDSKCSGINDDEQPASAAATALEEPFLTGDNNGFLRDDALLVIIAITDEDEQPTGEARTAAQIYQRIVNIKGGDVQKVVFLGIGSANECDGAYGRAWGSPKLEELTNMFIDAERGVWWDLCDGNLEDGLEDAFEVIEAACDELPIIV